MSTTYAGLFSKLMVKAGGTGEAGDYTEAAVARDVEVGLTKGKADVTTRGSGGFKNQHPTLKEVVISGELLYDPDDDGFVMLQDSFWNDTLVGLQALDVEDGQGVQGDFHVFEFSEPQPIDGVLVVKFSAEVGRSDNPPEWIGD